MPTYVRTDRCDGCKGRSEPACMHICPHDLMKLDIDGTTTGHAMKAWNQEPEQCWECYACVKHCPRQAVEVRHYADIVPLGAFVQPVQTPDIAGMLTGPAQSGVQPQIGAIDRFRLGGIEVGRLGDRKMLLGRRLFLAAKAGRRGHQE